MGNHFFFQTRLAVLSYGSKECWFKFKALQNYKRSALLSLWLRVIPPWRINKYALCTKHYGILIFRLRISQHYYSI